LWAYFLQLFSDGEIKGLKGKRVSDFRRTYCSPVEDRLPHEIYLLQGLLQQAKVNNRKIGNINLTMDYTEDKCLGFLTSEVFPLWFEVGYGQKLEAFWLAQCESKEVKIDFTNHTIYYERKLRSFWEQRNSTIPKMVNAILDGHKVVCDQIELIDNLCKLTSQKGVI
jgi:hypothetical protein